MHNLEWISDLEIQYDASTFDTDPFEPQPDGVETIFPFWVSRPSSLNSQLSTLNHPRSGYVELPYTLPQDSTVFNFLGKRPSASGGTSWTGSSRMAEWRFSMFTQTTLISATAYVMGLRFQRSATANSSNTLQHGITANAGMRSRRNWPAIAKRSGPPRATRKARNICMLAYSAYESDARIVRYAQTLVQRNDHVDVIAYGGETEALGSERRQRSQSLQDPAPVGAEQQRALSHLLPLLKFFLISGILVTKKHFHHPYDLIHVHNIPEWLVFAVSIPKRFGARILLDIHDLVPELFSAKFKRSGVSFLNPILRTVEACSCRFATT